MRVFYGVNGEGLGHASRTLSIVDQLPDCDIHIFTYGAAHRFLQSIGYPLLHLIHGLTFSYRRQRVDYVRSLWKAGVFYGTGLPRNMEQIAQAAARFQPTLFVSDFEPSVARAASACGRRLVSVDNQHRFVHCRLSELPRFLRLYAQGAGYATRLMVPRPDHVVISSFLHDQRPIGSRRVTMTGGLLRKSVEETTVANDGFLLAYVRPSISDAVLKALDGVTREVRVYGAADTPTRRHYERTGRYTFHPLSPDFVHDLARCDRLVASAGHQVICEACYFQKPLLAIPEPGQYEQHINAWYVQRHGLGMQCRAHRLTPDVVRAFTNYGPVTCLCTENGVGQVIQVMRNEQCGAA